METPAISSMPALQEKPVTDLSARQASARLIAFYLPQFHAIPENNSWWGEGFTEWTSVRKAGPLFRGHRQPRVPLDHQYRDLSDIKSIEWQVDLAKQYGIHGFCHYHYWFDGKQLLQKPTNLFMDAKYLDLEFCLAWANETWSRRWDGQDHHVLQLQTHEPDQRLWEQHFKYLINAWTDERAIRINNKPVFIIYRPHKITQLGNLFDYWQTRARSYGLDGIHFLTMKQYAFPDEACLRHFDGIIQFQPFDALHSMQRPAHPLSANNLARSLLSGQALALVEKTLYYLKSRYGSPALQDYDAVWSRIIEQAENLDDRWFPGAFVDWDNTARYGRRAMVFKGASPARFEYWLGKLLYTLQQKKRNQPYVFINAWNEWSEGTYLEPDQHSGYGYLEAVRRVLDRTATG